MISPVRAGTEVGGVHNASGSETRFAYRRIGRCGGTPLVMAIRFRGTLAHWDPALLDVLASERDVLVFDNRGTGDSSALRRTPSTALPRASWSSSMHWGCRPWICSAGRSAASSFRSHRWGDPAPFGGWCGGQRRRPAEGQEVEPSVQGLRAQRVSRP
jgi:pimeloyl-ACP methyl ester carboxylesterase